MIKAVIRGGLGNQLFQYAAAYAIAERLNQPITLDISFYPTQTLRGYKLNKLKLTNHLVAYGKEDFFIEKIYKNKYVNGLIRRLPFECLPIKNGKYLVDHAGSFTPTFFDIVSENIFMNGYFQSEEYFKNVRKSLIEQIAPNYPKEEEYARMLDKILTVNSVALHVRHGDFLADDNCDYHYILSIDYYKKAIEIIKKEVSNPVFFCFSDDIDWVKNSIVNEDIQYVSLKTTNADIDEMMLMKNCKHIITANSTFSWWAAWLNENENAIRIVPEKPYGNAYMIPENWIKIPVE